MNGHESLEPVLNLSHGRTLGGELMFSSTTILEAISKCSHHDLAILGVELFGKSGDKYRCFGFSVYEVKRQGLDWAEFVIANNLEATRFVKQNVARDDQFYLMTAVNRTELTSNQE